jgi:glycerol-3-phosphate acyltransferase PlsY
MAIWWSILLVVSSFFLGACPFSVWIGQRFMGKDVRHYGDHNPGASNVFRAGSIKWGLVAVILDSIKGVPLVIAARSIFRLPEAVVFAVGLSAVLGHAFSPALGFRGGKATAVSCGVVLALELTDVLFTFWIFMLFGFIIMDGDSWRLVMSTFGALIYVLFARNGLWESIFMLAVLLVVSIKCLEELKVKPCMKKTLFMGSNLEKKT